MTLRDVLLTLHILTAIVLIGWLATQTMLLPRLIRQGPGALETVRFTHATSQRLGPISSVVFLLGLWLVGESGYSFGDSWVSAAMGLYIALAVIGAVFIARTSAAAIAKFEQGQPAPEEARRVAMLAGISNAILLVIVYLMVAKPG